MNPSKLTLCVYIQRDREKERELDSAEGRGEKQGNHSDRKKFTISDAKHFQ